MDRLLGRISEALIEERAVPLRHRHTVRSRGETFPYVLDKLQSFARGQLEDLITERALRHEGKLMSDTSVGKPHRNGLLEPFGVRTRLRLREIVFFRIIPTAYRTGYAQIGLPGAPKSSGHRAGQQGIDLSTHTR
jgi:hypothetical protein